MRYNYKKINIPVILMGTTVVKREMKVKEINKITKEIIRLSKSQDDLIKRFEEKSK